MCSIILLDQQEHFKDFGNIVSPVEKIVSEAVKYYDEYGTLGEYTHLKLKIIIL